MVTVCEKGKCTGCMECIDTCPKDAIEVVDVETEYNAIIDSDKCIKCNMCHKACQNNRELILTKPICWKQGWAADDGIRMGSSSGGIAETENEVIKFTGSKYVKSNPYGIYKKLLEKLKEGKKVLFVGLPCQVAAAKHYTKNHQNLYTIDLICHGTPSPEILEKFLEDYNVKLTEIENIKFRVKNSFKLEQNGKRFSAPTTTDNYLITFLNSTSYTENCYQCNYAQLDRAGDITLGDSWGSELEKQIQDEGISLLLCQNEKGKELINQTDLVLMDVDLEKAIENNHQLQHPSLKPQQRKIFFGELNKGHAFKSAVRKCYPKKYLKNAVKTLLYKVNLGGEAKPLSSNCCYEYNWKSEINKWKTVSYNFTTEGLFFQNFKFARLRYRTLAIC